MEYLKGAMFCQGAFLRLSSQDLLSPFSRINECVLRASSNTCTLKVHNVASRLQLPPHLPAALLHASLLLLSTHLLQQVHPDKHPSFPQESTVAFQRVSEAYAGLKDDVCT